MKKILVALVAVLFAAPSFAQFTSGGFTISENNVYYGIRVGLNVASLGGDVAIDGSKAGMTLGGIVGLRLSESAPAFLESGLYYSEYGAKDGKQQVNYNNVEIPVLIKYGIQATDEIAILPFFGPTFARAFSGKTKQFALDADGKPTGDIEKVGTFDEDRAWTTGGLKRLNMGLKLGCGIEFSNLYAELGYHFGVTNISKDDNLSAHKNALFVNVGVNF